MITKRLKTLILLSIPLYFFHGMEEYFTNFYQIDPISRFAFQYFENMNPLAATFLLFQIMILVLLTISYLLINGGKYILVALTFFGCVFIFELHHLIQAAFGMSYYPGLITSMFIYMLGLFYWKELILIWKKNYGKN